MKTKRNVSNHFTRFALFIFEYLNVYSLFIQYAQSFHFIHTDSIRVRKLVRLSIRGLCTHTYMYVAWLEEEE